MSAKPYESYLQNKVVLITGGTGSLGRELVKTILPYKPKKVIVYSRGEYSQVKMRHEYKDNTSVRFFIGDIRDRNRLYRALDGVDHAIHCAALKHLPVCEYDPFEAVQTNILGAQHIIDAAIDRGVNKVVAVSSDKAVNPANLYAATKLASDKLFVNANAYVGNKPTQFSVIRFGNFVGSRGSVIPHFQDLARQGVSVVPVTDTRMTRFWIRLPGAAEAVLNVMCLMRGGEIFTPGTMPSVSLTDIAWAIFNSDNMLGARETGIRPGEKLHEDLISKHDIRHTEKRDGFYITYSRRPERASWVPIDDKEYNSLSMCQQPTTEWIRENLLK